jgi:hypothetical protein
VFELIVLFFIASALPPEWLLAWQRLQFGIATLLRFAIIGRLAFAFFRTSHSHFLHFFVLLPLH